MPANLDAPIDIIGPPSNTAEISIQELVIRPPVGDQPGSVGLALMQGDGVTAHRIPGIFTVDDCDAHTETVGGRQFVVDAGTYFSDMAAGAPSGASMFEAVKLGAYAGLMAKYTDLAGNVT